MLYRLKGVYFFLLFQPERQMVCDQEMLSFRPVSSETMFAGITVGR